MTRDWINIPDDAAPRLVLSLDVQLSDEEKARLRAAFDAARISEPVRLIPQPSPADLEHWQAQAASCKEIADHLWSVIRKARAAAGPARMMDASEANRTLNAVMEALKEADH